MFLELSFDSTAGGKAVSTSKASRSWRYDHEDKEEMSLDELVSDFQQSATSHRSRLNQTKPSSNTSPVLVSSPPTSPQAKKNSGRLRAVKTQPTPRKPIRSTIQNAHHDDSSDEEVAVSPMPRIEQALRNRPSLVSKRCSACSPVSTQFKPTTSAHTQRRKPEPKSPVLSSPSFTPPSLSPVTSSPSPSYVSEDINTSLTPDEDSIDALIGKEIRDLNELISTGSRIKASKAARTSTTDELSNIIRQSTRFGKTPSKGRRPSLRLDVSRGKFRSSPESPPPPPPPEDSEDDEDSFAEEIRKLRESRRLSSITSKGLESTPQQQEEKAESPGVCVVAAMKVRNAANTINELLLEALKPFEGREKEEKKDDTPEEDKTEDDAAIRNAANAELQSATQTIVSQLDLTFADMTERRKADVKAEEDAAAAAKEAEKKEKGAAEEKKKAEEKETKEREMEILRLIPMRGKLLTCSADIENVLQQLERVDISTQRESTVEAEIKTLRSLTERKIQEIEAKLSIASSKNEKNDTNVDISWRNVDWVQDNLNIDLKTSERQDSGKPPEEAEDNAIGVAPVENGDSFEEVVQRQVLEKLDLTMLKLRHVLAIDTKETAEVKETQQREQEELERKQLHQQIENERAQREKEDAETARRRVMGLTSIDDVEGWIDEGRSLHDQLWHNQSLNRLVASMEQRMGVGNCENPHFSSVAQNQNVDVFDRLASAPKAQEPHTHLHEREVSEGAYCTQDKSYGKIPERCRIGTKRTQELNRKRWIKVSSSYSGNEVEADNESSGSESDGQLPSSRDHRQLSPRGFIINSRKRNERDYRVDKNPNRRIGRTMIQRRHKRDVSSFQHEVAQTIQALQAERRHKTTWIRSRLCSPSRPAF
ncbi:hypothetical protein L914_06995 [Phytophthora nicotianae]|uniref:Uncharacterized protein n=1 Tax=Phytophthora nicotianae TaxID=4792 RepID=W2NIP2_PHYNI|nr:hypothetical protein L914_06995 [Phytophthora nicotianae]